MRRMFIDDEEASEEHKRRSHTRLTTLVGYCETAQCRRQILLGYFGEEAVPCRNCDNCLDQTSRVDGAKEAKIILAAVGESGARFGATHIVDLLRGTRTQKIVERGHDRLASFGSGASRKREEWQSLIRQLAASGFLIADAHGGLGISQQGRALARGEVVFAYRAIEVRASNGVRPVSYDTTKTADSALLAALKAERMRLARERQVPAYVIFSDRTLIDMAARQPRDLDTLAEVHGVGAARLRDFGELFLRAIAMHT
jgi:ATP-dependent DNA helicase RecQ